jgi:small-conductance mechanosensitive channel
MTLDALILKAQSILDILVGWLTSPQFYAQAGAIVAALIVARLAARQIKARVSLFKEEPREGPALKARRWVYLCRDLLFPLLAAGALAIGVAVAGAAVGSDWLIRLAQSAAVVGVLYAAINRFVPHPIANALCRWVGLPVAALLVFGVLDETTAWLDSIALELGNIRISLFALIKAAIFGGILFWLGRMSTDAGQKVIRRQQALDVPTRELFAKLFEIALYFAVFFLLMQILGLDLTALTVFGGALGVGLGFGLQQIAANFISGIIILLERSLKTGDFIELEDGKAGTLREINMRSSTLSTFDGKDIMVPNETFITKRFVNWTHTDANQRCTVPFQVPYGADMHRIPPLVEAAVAGHPRVLREPEPPGVSMTGFGDRGVRFAVQFWVGGPDEGETQFSSAVHFLVWDALQAAGIAMAVDVPQPVKRR